MAKHKKTRRDKKVADQRHTLYHLETEPIQEKIKVSKKEISPTYISQHTNNNLKAISYDYLTKDLKKIVLVSSAIFATQIVLFFILN